MGPCGQHELNRNELLPFTTGKHVWNHCVASLGKIMHLTAVLVYNQPASSLRSAGAGVKPPLYGRVLQRCAVLWLHTCHIGPFARMQELRVCNPQWLRTSHVGPFARPQELRVCDPLGTRLGQARGGMQVHILLQAASFVANSAAALPLLAFSSCSRLDEGRMDPSCNLQSPSRVRHAQHGHLSCLHEWDPLSSLHGASFW